MSRGVRVGGRGRSGGPGCGGFPLFAGRPERCESGALLCDLCASPLRHCASKRTSALLVDDASRWTDALVEIAQPTEQTCRGRLRV